MCVSYKYLFSGFSCSVEKTEQEAVAIAMEKYKDLSRVATFSLYKRSVDARKKENILFVYTLLLQAEQKLPQKLISKYSLKELVNYQFLEKKGSEQLASKPLVVGMGPAGLFCALLLAKNGYQPILIDRGASVEERVNDVNLFREKGILNTNSNVQFGAGGAGTFSDGKLMTRIHDARCSYVLDTFVKYGAPQDILYEAKPHIGTDILRKVVANMLKEIETLGGEIHYHTTLLSFEEKANGYQVKTSNGELFVGAVILAIGNSARDTYKTLITENYNIIAKPISIGVRCEHLQEEIDKALYGNFAGHPHLHHAEYTLSDTTGERGVYTFCMCPGGEVMSASSEENSVVVNGMSYRARDGKNANSAVAVSISPNEIENTTGNEPLNVINFQRAIEQTAFHLAGKNYNAPVMTLGNFLSGKGLYEPKRVTPSYRDGKVTPVDFTKLFPTFVCNSLKQGFASFGRKISGFDAPDTVLTAPETRTSAPVRILRNNETYSAIGHDKLYPCGEGAGYAGGITSSAVDGVRVAEAILSRFSPLQ